MESGSQEQVVQTQRPRHPGLEGCGLHIHASVALMAWAPAAAKAMTSMSLPVTTWSPTRMRHVSTLHRNYKPGATKQQTRAFKQCSATRSNMQHDSHKTQQRSSLFFMQGIVLSGTPPNGGPVRLAEPLRATYRRRSCTMGGPGQHLSALHPPMSRCP